MDEGILEVSELAGDRVVELRVVELRVVASITCEREGIVGGDEGPGGGVGAGCQSRSQSRSTWRGRTGKRRGSAGRGKRRSRATQREMLIMDGMWMKVKDSRDDLSQCGCDTCVMQACSDLAHVVLVLVGVRRVTVVIVHIGHEGVLVVIHFCVAILFVNCCIRRYLFTPPVGDSRLR